MEKKEFREEFSQFMKQTGKSQKQVSKETGLSTSVISQFLDGKYTGDNGKVQDILNKFLSISKDRLNSVSGTTYYPDLYNTKEVLYACWYAHKYNDIALVAGDAGSRENHRAGTLQGQQRRRDHGNSKYLHHIRNVCIKADRG